MFCTGCGAQIEDGAMFCPKCGTPTNRADNAGGTPTRAPQSQVTPQTPTVQAAPQSQVTPQTPTVQAAPQPQVTPQTPTVQTAPPQTPPVQVNIQRAPSGSKKPLVIVLIAVIVLGLAAIVAFSVFGHGGKSMFSKGVSINEANFPDTTFRAFVTTTYDANSDGTLSTDEISAVTTMDVSPVARESTENIGDLTGIGNFTALEDLTIGANTIATVDLSQNTDIQTVDWTGGTVGEVIVPDGTDANGLKGSSATIIHNASGDQVVIPCEPTELSNFQIYNGVLYEGCFYGSDKSQADVIGGTVFSPYTQHFIFHGGMRYYTSLERGTDATVINLYRSNIDGSDEVLIASDVQGWEHIYLMGDSIVYKGCGPEGEYGIGIVKLDLQTLQETVIVGDTWAVPVATTDEYLFYTNSGTGRWKTLYRTDANGGNAVAIFDTGDTNMKTYMRDNHTLFEVAYEARTVTALDLDGKVIWKVDVPAGDDLRDGYIYKGVLYFGNYNNTCVLCVDEATGAVTHMNIQSGVMPGPGRWGTNANIVRYVDDNYIYMSSYLENTNGDDFGLYRISRSDGSATFVKSWFQS